MTGCAQIYLREVPENTPSQYLDDDGNLSLDLPVGFSFTQERIAEKLNDINKIEIGGTLGFNAPRTPKNDWIFSRYTHLLNLDAPAPRVPVVCIEGMSPLRHDILLIGPVVDDWSLELGETEEPWAVLAKRLYLKDVDLGTFIFNTLDVFLRQNDTTWDDGDDVIVQFPPVWFGKWYVPSGGVWLPDLRPHHYVLPLLRIAFCHIGYTFVCPFLETEVGRSLISYILTEQYGYDPDQLAMFEFRALKDDFDEQVAAFLTEQHRVIFDQEDFDPGNYHNEVQGHFSGVGVFKFTVTGKAKVVGQWELRIIQSSGGVDTTVTEFPIIGGALLPKNVDIIVESGEVDMGLGDTVFVTLRHPSQPVDPFGAISHRIEFSGSFFNTAIRTTYLSGDTIDLAEIIHPDYTLFAFYSGIVHALSGRIEVDEVTKVHTLFTPYDLTIDGENSEGYYKQNDGFVDLRPLQVRKPKPELIPNTRNQNRYVLLAFKDSTDSGIEKLGLPDTAPMYSFKKDMGSGRIDGTTELKNPFFEPTQCLPTFIGSIALNLPPATLPHMLDNLDGNRSYKIGPRLLIYGGYIDLKRKRSPNDTVGTALGWQFEFIFDDDHYPYAYQELSEWLIYPVDTMSELELVYGDKPIDLYKKMWSRILQEEYNSSSLRLPAIISQANFNGYSFRDEYLATFDKQDFVGRLFVMSDFQGCLRRVSRLGMFAQLQTTEECYDDPGIQCNNHPQLVITYDEPTNTYTFSVNNDDVESAIEEETIEWRYPTDTEWTEGTVLVDPTQSFFVRLNQTYTDGCSRSIIIRFYDACGNSAQLIITVETNAFGERVYTLSISGVYVSPVDTQTITYTIDGGAPITYTVPFVPPLGSELCVQWEVTFTDSCSPLSGEECFEVIDDDTTPPELGEECHWVYEKVLGIQGAMSTPAPLDIFMPGNPPVPLPDPSSVSAEIISLRVLRFRGGRKLIFTLTPTQVEDFGIDYINQEITYGKPLSAGEKLEGYHLNCPSGFEDPGLGQGYWVPWEDDGTPGLYTDAPPDIYKPGTPPVVLANPASIPLSTLRKANIIYRDGRKLLLVITPTTINDIGIDFANQRYVYGKPKDSTNKIEGYVWQNI